MFYNVIKKYRDVIKDVKVQKYQKIGNASSLAAEILFKNNCKLFVKDYIFLDGKRKYSYHLQNAKGNMIIRWDNSPHHEKILTFPHHKHMKNKVLESKERSLLDIFFEVTKLM